MRAFPFPLGRCSARAHSSPRLPLALGLPKTEAKPSVYLSLSLCPFSDSLLVRVNECRGARSDTVILTNVSTPRGGNYAKTRGSSGPEEDRQEDPDSTLLPQVLSGKGCCGRLYRLSFVERPELQSRACCEARVVNAGGEALGCSLRSCRRVAITITRLMSPRSTFSHLGRTTDESTTPSRGRKPEGRRGGFPRC